MTDITGDTLTISDVVRAYDITHGKLYRHIKSGRIPADALIQQKYKGRKGWRHIITRAAIDALNLSPRIVVTSETPQAETSVA
jgi:hypothetical protein